jgi:hypothetical protein
MAEKQGVAITVDVSANANYRNFTFAPTTLHLDTNSKVYFRIAQGDAHVKTVDLYFDHSPFSDGETKVHVEESKNAEKTIGTQKGAFHYKAVTNYLMNQEVRVAFDIWCPSIIVD